MGDRSPSPGSSATSTLRGAEVCLVDIERLIQEHAIDTVKVGAVDIDGIWRGKRLPAEYFLRDVWRHGTHISTILFGWDSHDALIPGLEYTGWHTGYPDLFLVPDLTTFAVVPWEEHTATVIADFVGTDGEPVAISPRHVLRKVIERAERLGYSPKIGYEFEFYLFRETMESVREKRFDELTPLTPGVHTYSLYRGSVVEPIMGEVRRAMARYGISIEACNTECGPGQFEISLHYADAMRAADQAVLYKAGVKEIAAKHGLLASFMAKYHPEWSGSSGHIHQSLGTADAGNAFYSDDTPDQLSDVARWYAGGVLASMREFTAFICPTVNSYKRTVDESWASTTATWGIDNRTTGLRVVNWTPQATRLEHRQPGADANPYIAVAASVAAGVWGVENRVGPPDLCVGNAYGPEGGGATVLPRTLEEAVGELERGELARELLGREFVEHFLATRRWELKCARTAVTDWERARYLEII